MLRVNHFVVHVARHLPEAVQGLAVVGQPLLRREQEVMMARELLDLLFEGALRVHVAVPADRPRLLRTEALATQLLHRGLVDRGDVGRRLLRVGVPFEGRVHDVKGLVPVRLDAVPVLDGRGDRVVPLLVPRHDSLVVRLRLMQHLLQHEFELGEELLHDQPLQPVGAQRLVPQHDVPPLREVLPGRVVLHRPHVPDERRHDVAVEERLHVLLQEHPAPRRDDVQRGAVAGQPLCLPQHLPELEADGLVDPRVLHAPLQQRQPRMQPHVDVHRRRARVPLLHRTRQPLHHQVQQVPAEPRGEERPPLLQKLHRSFRLEHIPMPLQRHADLRVDPLGDEVPVPFLARSRTIQELPPAKQGLGRKRRLLQRAPEVHHLLEQFQGNRDADFVDVV
mmetsp:Transcript_12727/g.23140  ORF Transcript_12727/g.23140 Transcript_12727/m.23140 type:complete len:392 (+) Transcript_12727:256-1431(+)